MFMEGKEGLTPSHGRPHPPGVELYLPRAALEPGLSVHAVGGEMQRLTTGFYYPCPSLSFRSTLLVRSEVSSQQHANCGAV